MNGSRGAHRPKLSNCSEFRSTTFHTDFKVLGRISAEIIKVELCPMRVEEPALQAG